jgi:hypothetical protein
MITRTLFGAVFVLSLTILGAAAQPGTPPAEAAETAAQERAEVAADHAAIAQQRVQLKADIADAKAQAQANAVTRQQIQAIRAALRAKLAALHH